MSMRPVARSIEVSSLYFPFRKLGSHIHFSKCYRLIDKFQKMLVEIPHMRLQVDY